MKVIGIVGWKNSGKTTLIEKLVSHFVSLGFRVATVKHAHHSFDLDQPGKDSYRHRAAGARQVIIASARRWTLIHELAAEAEPTLEDLLVYLTAADLVIVEGYKEHRHPKIEVILERVGRQSVAATESNVIAIATNVQQLNSSLPRLSIDDAHQVADFIADRLELEPPISGDVECEDSSRTIGVCAGPLFEMTRCTRCLGPLNGDRYTVKQG